LRMRRGVRMTVRALVAIIALGYVYRECAGPRASRPVGPATNPLVAARPYRIKAPAVIDAARSYPLVIVLHGLGARSEKIERYYQLDPLVDELGFLAAYPDGTEEKRTIHVWDRRRQFW